MDDKEEYIDKHIGIMQDQIKKLEEKKNVLTQAKTVIENEKRKFKCPLGKSDEEAICTECPNAIPIPSKRYWHRELGDTIMFKWPSGKHTTEFKHPKGLKGCTEWELKKEISACGCGGNGRCECGFYMDFCTNPRTICPYCGRNLKINRTKFVPFSDTLTPQGE